MSHSICDLLKTWYPNRSDKITIIPNGVSVDFLKINKQHNNRSPHFRFIIIGNITVQKGIDIALKALSRLREQKKIEIHIVGDGPEKSDLITLASKLDVLKQVKFHGAIPPKDVPLHFKEADALLLTSYSEGRPNVVH